MAVKIRFDAQHNAEQPTLVLATKNGRLLGKLLAHNMQFKDTMNSYSELRFDVYKKDHIKNKGVVNTVWEQIKDFKLAWAKEWNILFEIYVEVNEADETIKNISAKSLGEVELSQIKLYNIEINTETDIEREDYEPTIIFDEGNAETSLLNRIVEKAPHYRISHVDSTIANLQRTFEFNNTTIYDAFQRISEEVDCLFVIRCYLDADGKVVREINVYDLEANCLECNHRGEFSDVCPECGSKNVKVGYGEDTTIFVSTENLANNITYSTDEGSVKNCFRLEAGDDLMTATLVNCNPNGSGYIWYVSDDMKEDMSEELVKRLNEYDEIYDYYYREHKMEIEATVLSAYNALVEKYQAFTTDYKKVSSPITGYPALMQELYNTIDFYLYLNNSLMPSVEISRTTAALQAAKLNTANLSPVAVQNVDICSSATATSAVLAMAKTLIDSRYQVKVKESLLDELTWAGSFTVTSYSDEEDTATTGTIYVDISGDYEEFVKQKIEKVLSKSNDEATDIVSLFKLDEVQFKNELKKYSLVRLTSFNDCCQSCLDLLIEQGIADKETWANKDPDLYRDLYTPYYNKLRWIQEEIKVREAEISVIIGVYDKDGDLSTHGLQTLLEDERSLIQDTLNFEKYLGEELWLEFVSYRREDTYQNNNYISDGLNNAELFQHALEFIEIAKKEIFKSATLQHSISATLKNLLVMKEFSPIIDHFEIGNWLRCKVDGKLNLLRLLSYEINFNDLDNLSVTFSDVKMVKDGVSDVESILNQASSMATSYGAVTRQASDGKKSNEQLNDWVENGLSLTNMKIVGNADNQTQTWDSHGMLFRKYDSISDSYEDVQLKIINSTISITDDNWKSVKTAIGYNYYFDPETGKLTSAYGVNAETLVGQLILGEQLGIYNTNGNMTFNNDGLTVSNGVNTFIVNPNNKDQILSISNGSEKILYLDSDGEMHVYGSVTASSGMIGGWNIDNYRLSKSTIVNEGMDTEQESWITIETPRSNTELSQSTFLGIGIGAKENREWPFFVRHNGYLHATNANISGTISANKGKIGGWNIETQHYGSTAKKRKYLFIGDSYGAGYNSVTGGWAKMLAENFLGLSQHDYENTSVSTHTKYVGAGLDWLAICLGGAGFAKKSQFGDATYSFSDLLGLVEVELKNAKAKCPDATLISLNDITDIVVAGGWDDMWHDSYDGDGNGANDIKDGIELFSSNANTLFTSLNQITLFAISACSSSYEGDNNVDKDVANAELESVYKIYKSISNSCGWDFLDIHYWGDNDKYFIGDATDYFHPNKDGTTKIVTAMNHYLTGVSGRLYNNPWGYESDRQGFYLSNVPGDWAIQIGAKTADFSAVGGSYTNLYRPFMVEHNGTLWASNAHISGTILATSGKIGGCSIVDNVLKIKNVNIDEKLTVEHIDATNLTVNAVNVTGTLTAATISASKITEGSNSAAVNFSNIGISGGKIKIPLLNEVGTLSGYAVMDSYGIKCIDKSETQGIIIGTNSIAYTTRLNRNYLIEIENDPVSGGLRKRLSGTWCIGSYEAPVSVASDATMKNTVIPQSDVYSRIFDRLTPVTYKYNNGLSDRIHLGLIAQSVEDAVLAEGLTTKEFAPVCYDVDDEGNKYNYGIRYEELVSMCIYEIQHLKQRISELEKTND